ncbi:hypothetical protein GCM10022224_015140 [Nonomuraea antimicrobica]|uniref:DUF1996 domain-containing protein n=2 Tax=Nonomuraea antimicrobica TaxID=561173 RepID=A0ABP7B8U6_9ACTN
MAAAVSALAVAATGLVSAAVIGVGPVLADHCDPAEATRSPQPRQSQPQNDQPDQGRQDQGGQQDQGQQDQGQQNPGGQQDQDQSQQGQDPQQDPQQDQQAPQGGGVAVDPIRSPDAEAPQTRAPNTQAPDTQAPEADAPAAQPEEEPSAQSRRPGGNQPTRTATPVPSQTQDPGDGPTEEPTGTASPTATATASPSPTATGGDEEECADLGPFPEDFVDIRQVAQRQSDARPGGNGSRGTFVSQCGTNRNGHHNPDNFIVAPGVSNGAHHLHDYVGNLSTDAFSTDESLAAAGTTCRQSDRSTYFWPVLRDRRSDANIDDPDGNVGQVLRARAVTLQFRGNAAARVVAMPRFLRLITGDAKAATNGAANARAGWSCSGFQNRISPDKYTLCPRGSQVLRILDFPSCWDGQNTDSANHRTHVVFPDQSGACPQGTRAIPALRMTLAYNVPQGPSYAVDAFPEQKHNPITDHGDFANVMPDRLMQFVVSCINRGRRC